MADTQSDRITVACECGAKLGLRASFAGHKAKCPKCSRSFVVPCPDGAGESSAPAYPSPEKPRHESRPSAATQDTMKVSCPCGKHIRVPANATGRKARCPACGGIFVIGQTPASPAVVAQPKPAVKPAPKPASTPPPPQLEEYREEDDGTYGWADGGGSLLAEAEQQPAAAAGATYKLCPNCGQTMTAEARLCVACGFDTKTGRRMQDTAVSGGNVSAAVGSAARSAGAVLLGIFLSFVGAMVGAGLWCILAVTISPNLRIVALLVGTLAGAGMYYGLRSQSIIASLVASAMAAVGIVVAKIVIFFVLVVSAFSQSSQSSENPFEAPPEKKDRLVLAYHHARVQASRQGLSYDDEKRDALLEQQKHKYQSMSDSQVNKAVEDMQEWREGGKWKDSAYVRDCLIYSYVDEALEKEAANEDVDEDEPELTPEKWKQLYGTASARVDSMSADRQLAEAKKVDTTGVEEMDEAIADLEGAAEFAEETVGKAAVQVVAIRDFLYFVLALAGAFRVAYQGFGKG